MCQNFNFGEFLTQNKHLNATQYLLQHKGNTNQWNRLLADQLKIYPKASSKLPEFTKHLCWFTSKSYEQASSEASAIYKSQLFAGNQVLDLSGGLGVDDWAFSQTFNKVVSLDPDAFLNLLVNLNFDKLGRNNIQRITQKAEEFLKENTQENWDLIYLDADRRVENGKNFLLNQGAPNFLEIQDICVQTAKKILLKVSPMADLAYLQNTLENLENIVVLGDSNEVKEILLILNPGFTGTPEIKSVILQPEGKFQQFSTHQTHTVAISNLNKPNPYFFEPHPAIIKAGQVSNYAAYKGLQLIGSKSSFYTGNQLAETFMGRSFLTIASFKYSKNVMNQYLKTQHISAANVNRRNFRLSVDDIRKVHQLKDGGNDYLFFMQDNSETPWVFHCQKP